MNLWNSSVTEVTQITQKVSYKQVMKFQSIEETSFRIIFPSVGLNYIKLQEFKNSIQSLEVGISIAFFYAGIVNKH